MMELGPAVVAPLVSKRKVLQLKPSILATANATSLGTTSMCCFVLHILREKKIRASSHLTEWEGEEAGVQAESSAGGLVGERRDPTSDTFESRVDHRLPVWD